MVREPTIRLPHYSHLKALSKFTKEILEIDELDEFLVDTGRTRFFTPTFMMIAAKACRRRSRLYPREKMLYQGLGRHEYANNLGFSRALKIAGNKFPQGAFGGRSYIPMSRFGRDHIAKISTDHGIEFGDAIQIKCEDVAQIISQGKSESLRHSLSVSFREIFRNVFEHGETDTAGFCAQYWPAADRVEICIADRGIGVNRSLQSSKYTIPENDRQALYYALMLGVSSKAWRAKKKRASFKSQWDNSGFGLFFAHQLFRKFGHFFIASGNTALHLTDGKSMSYDCDVEGTVVSMSIDLSSILEIEETVHAIGAKAFEVKKRIGVKSLDYESVVAFISEDQQA
ncbi:hypothetical protein SAMN05444004_103122 [Jannaschia faecimaris]|uniref:Histidine kinase-, DNA gyrase B-, and HSP90-like ATPase n=1 Tax=Jannaschia faecimaris TaxID=1244108 RepID=A0A1H3MNS6_9RHOB|nr:hypothetical protein [Jannaschia faecimaris]SDY78098.1 hypothetical protein SAMN05444004_103122 [Jannaschia faecimaris]